MSYGAHTEQLCRHERPGKYRKLIKRRPHKIRRQRERCNPETAPTKNRYKGYST